MNRKKFKLDVWEMNLDRVRDIEINRYGEELYYCIGQIVGLYKDDCITTIDELAKDFEYSLKTTNKYLDVLIEKGLIEVRPYYGKKIKITLINKGGNI